MGGPARDSFLSGATERQNLETFANPRVYTAVALSVYARKHWRRAGFADCRVPDFERVNAGKPSARVGLPAAFHLWGDVSSFLPLRSSVPPLNPWDEAWESAKLDDFRGEILQPHHLPDRDHYHCR
jgi:hypothetical protein